MTSREPVPAIGAPFELPCGVVLKNRLVKAAMSDSLGDGAGDPTEAQIQLYERWAAGGAALSLIGEVQVDPRYPEKPGNLVLGPEVDMGLVARLAAAGDSHDSHVWPQLGHAGALAHGAISQPAGPSALDLDELRCAGLAEAAVAALPMAYAAAATRAKAAGFSGVQIHAGHGFLLSQFLSPLFNRRTDQWGGSIEARTQIVLAIIRQIRAEVGPEFAVAIKINSSDQLEGGLTEADALVAVEMIGRESIDLIDISGGTYFPGAAASSDRATRGPYFLDFARKARAVTDTPLMVTGGFKTRHEASDVVRQGDTDLVGLARAMVVDPALPERWLGGGANVDPRFPRFASTPPGGVTAWYTMRLTDLAEGDESKTNRSLQEALEEYEARDAARVDTWNRRFS
ncbi:MAG: oxidoreductase [Acidimicrobiales bacterium]|nr:oxidoreductase [Acidimicrobiales bacterium]